MNNLNLRKYLAEGKMVKETASPDKLTTENNNPELYRLVNRFLLNTAKKYGYTEQDAVYAIMSVLRARDFEGVDEGITIETSPEDLAKVKDVAKDDDVIKVTEDESKVPNSEVLDVIDSIQNLIKKIKNADPEGGSNLFTAAGPLVKELHKLVDLTEAETESETRCEVGAVYETIKESKRLRRSMKRQ